LAKEQKMKYFRFLMLPITLLTLIFCQGGANKNIRSLIETERAFSRLSAEKGLPTAFATYLADDALVFRPLPVPGKPLYQNRPAMPGVRLTWEPAKAGISRDGDLGFTTGPWELVYEQDGAQKTSYGHFVSIWKKQPDGAWRVAIDLGVDHKRPATGLGEMKQSLPEWPISGAVEKSKEMEKLGAVDADLYSASSAEEMASGYEESSEADVWLLRDGAEPFIGRPAGQKYLLSGSGVYSCRVDTLAVSSSADLGCSIGTIKQTVSDSVAKQFSYLHIWRKGKSGDWRLVLDIALAITANP
jgi:ketosteroid isomerase-like protein